MKGVNINAKSSWVIGGTTMKGVGIGLVFLSLYGSGLLMAASIIIGVGLGVALSPLVSRVREKT